MTQSRFIDDEELIGRTIARVEIFTSEIHLGFSDGTYTVIAIDPGHYRGETELCFDDRGPPNADGEAFKHHL